MQIASFSLKSKWQDLYLNENGMYESDTIRVYNENGMVGI